MSASLLPTYSDEGASVAESLMRKYNQRNRNPRNSRRNSAVAFDVSIKTSSTTGTAKKLKRKFRKTDTVLDVKKCYVEEESNQYTVEQIDFAYKKILLNEWTLNECGINFRWSVVFTVIFHARGGSDDIHEFDEKDEDIKLSQKQDCVYGYSSNDGVQRAEMPCGHAFAAETMFYVIKYTFNNTADAMAYEIRCPARDCDVIFDFDLAACVAGLNEEEYFFFIDKIQQRSTPDTVICPTPTCGNLCMRPDNLLMFRVNCISCKGSDFCWFCAKKWTNASMSICGNNGCETGRINELLQSCNLKDSWHGSKSNKVKIPELRACPKCFRFISHSERCKHMECADCKHEFCFKCLGQWPCKDDECKIADRQQLK